MKICLVKLNKVNNFQEKEVWKEIEGFEGLYEVSTKGRIRNLKTGKIRADRYDWNGYKIVRLKGKEYLVHRLTALAFIDNPHKLPYINHKNEKKDDNNVENLEWCSPSYNVNYSIYKQSCQIKQIDKGGNLIKIWNSSWQIERETGYKQSNIINCCKSKYKQAYGFKWEYADPSQQQKHNRPVAALTKDGEFVAEYKSAAEASRCLKIKYQYVYRCLKGTYKSTHGLKFIYID